MVGSGGRMIFFFIVEVVFAHIHCWHLACLPCSCTVGCFGVVKSAFLATARYESLYCDSFGRPQQEKLMDKVKKSLRSYC